MFTQCPSRSRPVSPNNPSPHPHRPCPITLARPPTTTIQLDRIRANARAAANEQDPDADAPPAAAPAAPVAPPPVLPPKEQSSAAPPKQKVKGAERLDVFFTKPAAAAQASRQQTPERSARSRSTGERKQRASPSRRPAPQQTRRPSEGSAGPQPRYTMPVEGLGFTSEFADLEIHVQRDLQQALGSLTFTCRAALEHLAAEQEQQMLELAQRHEEEATFYKEAVEDLANRVNVSVEHNGKLREDIATERADIVDLRDKMQPTRAEIALMKHHIKHGAHRQKYGKS